jgi:hypothetical protein
VSSHQLIVASDHLVTQRLQLQDALGGLAPTGVRYQPQFSWWCLVTVMVQFSARNNAENVFLGEHKAPVELQSDESKQPPDHL